MGKEPQEWRQQFTNNEGISLVKFEVMWHHENPGALEVRRVRTRKDVQWGPTGEFTWGPWEHRRWYCIDDPHPHPHMRNTQKHSLQFLKLRLNGCPKVLILNFPLQQVSFCLFQKRDRIKFYCAFYTWKPPQQNAAVPPLEDLFFVCGWSGQPKSRGTRGRLHAWQARAQVSTSPRSCSFHGNMRKISWNIKSKNELSN